jgi:hypothetical protein
MKTPRKLLLERHAPVDPKLDAIREQAVKNMACAREARAVTDSPGIRFLRELLWSLRWHAVGMSAVWLLVAILNSETSHIPTATMARQGDTPAPDLLLVLAENRRHLLEMIDSPNAAEVAPPKPFVPRRRSEVQPDWEVV